MKSKVILYPDLTPFGVWLMEHLPRFKRLGVETGEKFCGFVNKKGFIFLAYSAAWYPGYWPRMPFVPFLVKRIRVGFVCVTWIEKRGMK